MGVWTPALLLPASNTNKLAGIAAFGTSVHLAYIQSGNLFVQRSLDEGRTWSAQAQLATSIDDVPLTSNILIDGPNVHLFVGRQIDSASLPAILDYWRSTDNGVSWSQVATIDNGVAHGNNRFYRLSVDGRDGHIYVGFVSTNATNFSTDGLYFTKSDDNGTTWSTPALINSGTISSPSRPALSLDGDVLHIAFTDTRNGTATGNTGDPFYVCSKDRGGTWQTEVQIASTTGTSLRPDISAFNGKVCLWWQTPGNGTDDLWYTYSDNGGVSWDSNTQFSNDATVQEHCFLANVGGKLVIAYGEHKDVSPSVSQCYVLFPEDSSFGRRWVRGNAVRTNPNSTDQAAPRIAASNKFVHVIYADNTAGGLTYQRQYIGEFPG